MDAYDFIRLPVDSVRYCRGLFLVLAETISILNGEWMWLSFGTAEGKKDFFLCVCVCWLVGSTRLNNEAATMSWKTIKSHRFRWIYSTLDFGILPLAPIFFSYLLRANSRVCSRHRYFLLWSAELLLFRCFFCYCANFLFFFFFMCKSF